MTSGLVIHLEIGADKHTEVLTQDRIRIGSCEDCQLRLQFEEVPTASGLVIELARTNGHYRVTNFDPSLAITHNGLPLASGIVIEDGDEVRLGPPGNLALQFFPIGELSSAVIRQPSVHVAPFIEHAAIEAAATARRDDAKVFLREFTRELIREINPSTKLITLLIAIALVGGVLYLGFAANRELQRSRALIDAQNRQLVLMKEGMDENSKQFEQVDKSNKDIIYSLSLAPKLRNEYGNGVCLIAGSYVFIEESTNRPLRYPELQMNEDGTTQLSGEGQPSLTPEGNGAIYVLDFVGTGFHVGDGYIVTNRHVGAEPWAADERAQSLSASVSAKPRMTRLVAFFPEHRQPFPLNLKQAAQRDDLAVCVIDAKEVWKNIPVLPLDKDTDAAGVGKAVVMMGYPSGPDRILATMPEPEARGIQRRFGASMEALLGHLAERNLIKPLTTQGHITDLEPHRVVYDARTAEGGSGAPLFGQSGRVIGVNFAVFTEIADANFAVPIRYAMALLQRAGWKPKEVLNDPNVNTNTKDARAASAPATKAPGER